MRINTDIDKKVVNHLPNDAKKQHYKKMIKDYKNKLVKNAKETMPYDQGWLMEAIILNLNFMKEYYALNYNVHGEETNVTFPAKKDLPTREGMCAEILDAYEKWKGADDLYQVYHEHGGNENGKGVPLAEGGRTDWWFEPLLPTWEEVYNKQADARKKYKKLFFDLLEKYIDELWD